MGITASNLSFGEVNRRFYGRKLRFTAPLTRRRKTKFPTVKPPIYLPKCQIWMQLSPKSQMQQITLLIAFFFLIKHKYWQFVGIIFQADNSHEMSRFIFYEKKKKKKKKK